VKLDRLYAAEEEVEPRPANDLPRFLQPLQDLVLPAALHVQGRALDVHARGADRLLDRQRVGHHVPRDLGDGAREADRARAPEHEAGTPVLEHERRREHGGQARSLQARLVADHVQLAEHVVELCPAAEDARSGAQRRGERRGGARGVDDGDVRRAGERRRARAAVGDTERERFVLGRGLVHRREPLEDLDHDRAAARR
jgi:hypothetical protein